MILKVLIVVAFCCCVIDAHGQELFPLAESSNTTPKGVIGLRGFAEANYEIKTIRSLTGFKLMYGLSSRISLALSGSISNHHARKLPPDLISHTHLGSAGTYYFTNYPRRGVSYPFSWNGLHVLAKWRLFGFDGRNRHLRCAVFGEWSNVKQAHDEAEPNLLDDNRGYGGGIILSMLEKRFAVSMTIGGIIPKPYEEVEPDVLSGQEINRKLVYGDAFYYHLSFGYLLQGNRRNTYDETNTNIYLEFLGKNYGGAQFYYNGQLLENKNVAFGSGHYVEIYPGIQRIFHSNFRLDVSLGFSLLGKSYVHFYPLYRIGLQKYFFL
jgi:hypothetical protein